MVIPSAIAMEKEKNVSFAHMQMTPMRQGKSQWKWSNLCMSIPIPLIIFCAQTKYSELFEDSTGIKKLIKKSLVKNEA